MCRMGIRNKVFDCGHFALDYKTKIDCNQADCGLSDYHNDGPHVCNCQVTLNEPLELPAVHVGGRICDPCRYPSLVGR
ncbi:hypothetical protein FA15DRAFT_675994 [Coprinopsis marcescibilis]|uniref:Uncharacterized protein n=1 Tax=Coprinopsis marcescibilis TaxID=230819 RepID=A0A5C3KCB5_COPMA|nr:hypothetical protein FA15DRAFT_675994 [Coprinopsis marcescibilis]